MLLRTPSSATPRPFTLTFAALVAAASLTASCTNDGGGVAKPAHANEGAPDGGRPEASAPTPGSVNDEALATLLEEIRSKYELPALGGALVPTSGVVRSAVVGVRKIGDESPAQVTDSFHLGSDTKAMTAMVLAKLVESGKLSWETKVSESFADFGDEVLAEYHDVTLRDLLEMRGGLVSGWPEGETFQSILALEGDARQQRDTFVRKALGSTPEVMPQTEFLYSNASYVVAAAMGERAADKAWEEQLQALVFEPLGIESWGLGAAGAEADVDAPWPHRTSGDELVPVVPGPEADNPIALSPAGRVHMPLGEWAKFIADAMRGLHGDGALLSPQGYRDLLVPRSGQSYAGGFGSVERSWAGGRAYNHAGSNTMNYAVVWMAPERKLAALVVTNAATDSTPDACDEAAVALFAEAGIQIR